MASIYYLNDHTIGIGQNFSPMKTQLAGHSTFGESSIPCIMESDENNTILKLIQPPPRGQKELLFYRHLVPNKEFTSRTQKSSIISDSGVSSSGTSTKACLTTTNPTSSTPTGDLTSNSTDKASIQSVYETYLAPGLHLEPELLQELISNYIPKFYGIRNINGYDYLELENVIGTIKNPCMTDVKMGLKTYDPEATEEKKTREATKFREIHNFGYQFLGIKRGTEAKKDRSFGRSRNKDTIHLAYEAFLPVELEKRVVIINRILEKLGRILSWFERQKGLQFYGSSLLFVYCNETLHCDIRMIDFAHVFYEKDMLDENYMFGLRCLIRDFKTELGKATGARN